MATSQKILKIPLRISISILLIGMMARILDWPYASEIQLTAFFSIGTLYTFRFLKKPEKKFITYVKLILVAAWALNGIARIFNFQYSIIFQLIVGTAFLIWFVMEGSAYFLDEDRKAKNSLSQILWNCAMVMGTLTIIAGGLLKMLDWQYAIPLLVIGILTVVSYILKDVFKIPKVNREQESGNNEEYQL